MEKNLSLVRVLRNLNDDLTVRVMTTIEEQGLSADTKEHVRRYQKAIRQIDRRELK